MSSGFGFWSIVLLAFWMVLVSELVGDKVLYLLPSLTLRFRTAVVFAAFAFASAIKMLLAVLLGSALIGFRSHWIDVISALAFFVSAILIWVEEPEELSRNFKKMTWSKGALSCLGFFLFAEWGDPGQIAAAALALRSHLLLAAWLGATAAILTKGAVVLVLGLRLRDRLSHRALRWLACGSCCALGIITAAQLIR